MTSLPLIAATYFIVSGGPYGLEELIAKAGYDRAIFLLLITPLAWSLPTALMVGELASSLPDQGGYYAWVRRGLGPFWGFQEAWLSLAASVFDMAIYPTLFALYLGRLVPPLGQGVPAFAAGALLVATCVAWNFKGSAAVGKGSLWLGAGMLLPFALLAIIGIGHDRVVVDARPADAGLMSGLFVAMWNYMGWDNASTFASEVERPQRTYPIAILGTLVLVAATYCLPVIGARLGGVDPSDWTTGSWVAAASQIGGPALALGVVVGGAVSAAGSFASLILSYSRLPVALAEDGYLPRIFALRSGPASTPRVAILACGVLYTACLGIGFERLVALDVVLYGLSLLLEFLALIALRVREPELPRPFRIPGGLANVIIISFSPMFLLASAVIAVLCEGGATANALWLGAVIALAGIPLYGHLASRERVAPVQDS